MARPRINHESTSARLPKGTLARMGAVLQRFEGKADFIRDAVIKEIELREGKKRPTIFRMRPKLRKPFRVPMRGSFDLDDAPDFIRIRLLP